MAKIGFHPFLFAITVCCFGPGAAQALTLKAAQVLALEKNPQLQHFQQQKEGIKSGFLKYGLSPPPELSVEGGTGFSGGKEGLFEINLELEQERKNRLFQQAELAIGELELAGISLEEKRMKNQISFQVMSAYSEAWLAEQNRKELLVPFKELEQLVKVLTIQRDKGTFAGLSLEMVKAELSRDSLVLKKSEMEAQAKLLNLRLLLYGGENSKKLSDLEPPANLPDLSTILKGLEARSLELLEIRHEKNSLMKEADIISAEGKSGLTHRFSLGLEKPKHQDTEGIISFGMTKSFGNKRKTSYSLTENQLLQKALTQKYESKVKLLKLEIKNAYELALMAEEPLKIIQNEVLPRFKKNLET